MNLVILAGGASRRMGLPKYWLSIGDSRLYEYPLRRLGPLYDRQIIVENKGFIEAGDEQGRLVVRDIIADMGPLGGIYSGLKSSDALLNMVVGADMPFCLSSFGSGNGRTSADARFRHSCSRHRWPVGAVVLCVLVSRCSCGWQAFDIWDLWGSGALSE